MPLSCWSSIIGDGVFDALSPDEKLTLGLNIGDLAHK